MKYAELAQAVRAAIVSFDDTPPPTGVSPFVTASRPHNRTNLHPYDSQWPHLFQSLQELIRRCLQWRALMIEHIGSTAVPGLAAKPIVDIDVTVADPQEESQYAPALEKAGFSLEVRENWWYGHRMFRLEYPACNLHVFGPDCPETFRHRLFRDWLRGKPQERATYETAKAQAAAWANQNDKSIADYNARKQNTIRAIYTRAFIETGLLDPRSLPLNDFAFPGSLRDSLVAAVLEGRKTATSSLLAEFEADGKCLPTVGDLSVIVDSDGHGVGVLRETDVTVCSFDGVSLEHVVNEGKGFDSLTRWKVAHRNFWDSLEFRESFNRANWELTGDTQVVCELFELIQTLDYTDRA